MFSSTGFNVSLLGGLHEHDICTTVARKKHILASQFSKEKMLFS